MWSWTTVYDVLLSDFLIMTDLMNRPQDPPTFI